MTETTEVMSPLTEETEHITSLFQQGMQFLQEKLPALIAALVTLALGLVITRMLSKAITKGLRRTNADPTAVGFVQSFIQVALYLLVGVIVLSVLQVPIASIITVLGTMGLAIVLGLQNSLSNVAGGILILFSRPLKVGDYVEIGGITGTVEHISILRTKLCKPDGTAVFIPNGKVSDGIVLNYTERRYRRLDLSFGIGYDADAEKAKALIAAILEQHPYAAKDPAPLVRIGELSDSAVILHVRAWTAHEHYWDLYYDLYEQIKAGLDAGGIQFPYPQMDVHLHRETL
ncbi:MAG: mechanosensitive ion channel [Oscillospiraceae bacterium]|nr:mechanosensitive ion channel [Oscillospiraceae bacterium]